MKLKDLIKEKRAEKDWSQTRLAKLLGYSSGQFVSNWERGDSYPPMDRLAKMTLLFELEDNILFDLFSKENFESKQKEYEKALEFHKNFS